jgi:DNA-binding beta-propeller fold protein YncE
MKIGLAAALLLFLAGCEDPVHTFGRPGLGDGEFREPRAVSASAKGVAVIDRSGRLQLFDADGRFLSKFAVAGDNVRRGLPCGVTWLADGTIAVADTHQGYVKIYSAAGEVVAHFGGFGAEPGQFNMPQRVAELPQGRLAVSDYGTGLCNRVQVIDREGKPVLVFGGVDDKDGGLQRPMGIVPREDGSFVVADQKAGLVVFGADGRFAGSFGGQGPAPGSLLYGLCRAADGTYYATDLGHDRLLRVSPEGTVTGTFGKSGSEPGQFVEPWDVCAFEGRLYVADKGNHRVQRVDISGIRWEAP